MRIKRFNEQITDDLFEDEDLLDDILLEYVHEGFKYTKLYKLYKDYNDGNDWLLPVKTFESRKSDGFFGHSTGDVFDKSQDFFPSDAIRAYQIEFPEIYKNVLATDKQRGDNIRSFQTPTKDLYNFFHVTKEIQERIEHMGYKFVLSVHTYAEFDLLIIEPY